MILYVICQFVCVIDPWTYTSFVHSILSLKLGVTEGEAAAAAADASLPGPAVGAAGGGAHGINNGDPIMARASGGAVRVPALRVLLLVLLESCRCCCCGRV